MFGRHKHDWNLIDKTVIPGVPMGNMKAWGYDAQQILAEALESRVDHVVHVFKCDCGAVKSVKN